MMTNNCEFAERCGGGHTTAQHYVHVKERVIRESCGLAAFYAIEEAVNAVPTLQNQIQELQQQVSDLGWRMEGLSR